MIVRGRDLIALIRATSKVCSCQENLFGVDVEFRRPACESVVSHLGQSAVRISRVQLVQSNVAWSESQSWYA